MFITKFIKKFFRAIEKDVHERRGEILLLLFLNLLLLSINLYVFSYSGLLSTFPIVKSVSSKIISYQERLFSQPLEPAEFSFKLSCPPFFDISFSYTSEFLSRFSVEKPAAKVTKPRRFTFYKKDPTDSFAFVQYNASFETRNCENFLNWEYLKNGMFHLGIGSCTDPQTREFIKDELKVYLDDLEIYPIDRDGTGYNWIEMHPSASPISRLPYVTLKDKKTGDIVFRAQSPFEIDPTYGFLERPTSSHAYIQYSTVFGSTNACYIFLNWEFLRNKNFYVGVGGTCLGEESLLDFIEVYVDDLKMELVDKDGSGYFNSSASYTDPRVGDKPTILVKEKESGIIIFQQQSPFAFSEYLTATQPTQVVPTPSVGLSTWTKRPASEKPQDALTAYYAELPYDGIYRIVQVIFYPQRTFIGIYSESGDEDNYSIFVQGVKLNLSGGYVDLSLSQTPQGLLEVKDKLGQTIFAAQMPSQ